MIIAQIYGQIAVFFNNQLFYLGLIQIKLAVF